MRISQAISILLFANLSAGFLAGFAIQQPNVVLMWVGTFTAAAIAGASVYWFRKRLQAVMRQWSAFAGHVTTESRPHTGLVELDQLTDQLVQTFKKSVLREQAIARDETDPELEELRMFLTEFDRRDVSWDATDERCTLVTRLVDILREYGNEFESTIQQAVACAREIERNTQQIVLGADDQSDAVNRTTRHIETLSSEILTAGENAEFAMESSAKAHQSARQGMQEFEKIGEELEKIRNLVAARERKLQVLSQHSREIGAIVESIGKLSSRTDLLALNASIESVRAGEQGRGFALVAEEVRTLSEQSAQAVVDISSRLELIQLETQESLSVAAGEQDQIQRLIQRLSGTLAEMKNVGNAANDCVANASELSDASQNQLKALKDIVDELGTSSDVAKGNRIQAEGVHWTAKTLQQIGDQLSQSVKAFKHVEQQASVSFQSPMSDSEGKESGALLV